MLRAAVDAGIDHIDTAQYYGPAVVNELIREALHPYPKELAIVSKVGGRRDDSGAVLPFDEPHQLRQGIEENLATLGRLAAVNLRLIDSTTAPGSRFDAQLASLIHARQEGLIDGIGLSNISRQHLLRGVEQTEIACVQNLFNLADQNSIDVLHECTERGIAFVSFVPLSWPRGADNPVLTNAAVVEAGKRLGATPAQIALAWLLDLAPNILLIPGTRTRTHLAENLDTARVMLDEPARAALTAAFPAAH